MTQPVSVKRLLQQEVLRNAPVGRLFWVHVGRKLLWDTGGDGFVAHFRIGQALDRAGWKRLARFVFRRAERRYHCFFHPLSHFGEGLRVPHPVGIITGRGVRAGRNCSIYQNVTLGGKRVDDWRDNLHPQLGDDVLLSAGAVILGEVTIGDGASVGAGAVVLHDVPAHGVAVGVPAVCKVSKAAANATEG